jgi:hypothetical protein
MGSKKSGRPTIFTPELGDQIVKLVAAGNYMETAASAAGISKDTLFAWLKKGARDRRANKDTPLARFSDSVKKADAQAEARDVLTIEAASKKNWQAAAWRLERKHGDRWGRTTQSIEISGKHGGPIQTEGKVRVGPLKDRTNDELVRIEAAARAVLDVRSRDASGGERGGVEEPPPLPAADPNPDPSSVPESDLP